MHAPACPDLDRGVGVSGAYHHLVPSTPLDGPPPRDTGASATPSVAARVLAFGSIVFAGAAGGFIGWAFVDLQCEGDCTLVAGVTALIVAVLTAVGVGVVAVLALRALSEWSSQQKRGGSSERDPGLVLRRPPRSGSVGGDQPPRVR